MRRTIQHTDDKQLALDVVATLGLSLGIQRAEQPTAN